MSPQESTVTTRVTVDGKFFRLGARKFHPRGVTYGPFAPSAATGPFPARTQALQDFELLRELGANLVRVYEVPPAWFLDLAAAHDLRVFLDIPWSRHLCVLERTDQRRAAVDTVRQAARACRGHPALFAYSVASEIPPDIVRWNGARRTAVFIEQLLEAVRTEDPGCLCTFTSFPPTEFLSPQGVDFACFNLFLHERRAYESYLARLQTLAGSRPLLLGECGIDSLREGEARKCEILSWQIEGAFRAGLAGVVVFSFTDDWHRGGHAIEDWAFGLTTRDRRPKDSFRAVQKQFRAAPYYPLPRTPRVSVVVACHNGERTLKTCLDALSTLRYPDYEVLLVDDGSTDATPQIALTFPNTVCLRQNHFGLSVARNTGIAAATGEIVAFTDADCRPDEDWLYYVVNEMLRGDYAAVGGHNLLPPEDSRVAAAVMVSPGGPTHVMLTDRDAEHIPGCNMAFWKWALDDIGGFDPVFHQAGDDVDVCWRLQERGHRIGFNAAGFVWHYRRSTVRAYLSQQSGYGDAEALLSRKHPEYFNVLGGSIWRGRIYNAALAHCSLRPPVIYRGIFGTGLFQRLYDAAPGTTCTTFLSLEWHTLVTLPLLVVGLAFPFLLPLGLASLLLSLVAATFAGLRADVPRDKRAFWSGPLVATLFFLQPIVRGWARYRWRFIARSVRPTTFRRTTAASPQWRSQPHALLSYWTDQPADRIQLLQSITRQLVAESWEWKADAGWADYDLEIYGKRWSRVRLVTATEELGEHRRVLRCRLHASWSLAAYWAVGLLLGSELIVQAAFALQFPAVWLLLSLIPLLVLLIEYERRTLLQLLVALVEEAALPLGLVRLHVPPNVPPASGTTAGAKSPPARDAVEEIL